MAKKRFAIWRMESLHPAMWHDYDIDFVRWLHPAMWRVALKSWQWIHQVAASCNVIRGSGMTCHWIRPNVRHIGILHRLMVSISTHHRSRRHSVAYQSAKFYPNRTLGRKKWRHIDFQDGGSQPSWIVGIQWWVLWKAQLSYRSWIDTIALNCLVFEKIAFLHFGDRQTDGQTDKRTNRWTAPMCEAAVSLSRAVA